MDSSPHVANLSYLDSSHAVIFKLFFFLLVKSCSLIFIPHIPVQMLHPRVHLNPRVHWLQLEKRQRQRMVSLSFMKLFKVQEVSSKSKNRQGPRPGYLPTLLSEGMENVGRGTGWWQLSGAYLQEVRPSPLMHLIDTVGPHTSDMGKINAFASGHENCHLCRKQQETYSWE